MMLEADSGLFPRVLRRHRKLRGPGDGHGNREAFGRHLGRPRDEGGGRADIDPSLQAANPRYAYDGTGNYFLIHHTQADTSSISIDPADVSRASAAIAVMAYVGC